MGLPPKKKDAPLTEREKERILTLKDEGNGPTTIWHKTGIPRSTVSSFLNRHAKTDNSTLARKPGSGAKKKLSLRAERALVRTALKEPRMTLKALASPSKSGQQLNHHTVAKVLKRYEKAKRRPRKKPYLNLLHKKKRRAHCRDELATRRNPRRVCWSDEVTFHIGEDGSTFYIIRGAGRDEEYKEQNLRPSFKSGRESVGVWACFCGDEIGPIYILPKKENMNSKRYHWVLQHHFIPFYNRMREKYGDEVCMQQDNASWHTAKLITRYLESKGITMMSHPPQSPDLNPIENVWKRLKDRLGKRKHRLRNRPDFTEALLEEWEEMDKNFLLKLCDSMPRRYKACLKNKGGATKY